MPGDGDPAGLGDQLLHSDWVEGAGPDEPDTEVDEVSRPGDADRVEAEFATTPARQ